MNKLKALKKGVECIFNFFLDTLTPENIRIKRILNLDESDLKKLLPRSRTHEKDIVVLFDYQNQIVKLLVKSIKYKNNNIVRAKISKYLYDEILEICSEAYLFDGKLPILVPIPMGKKEKRQRGFNQCEEIVIEINKLNNKNFIVELNNLIKTRETERQTKLKRSDRLKNVYKSMGVSKKEIFKNRTVIVLDDVFTTLSTFNEAKRVLNESGAKKVVGLFVAH